MWLRRLVGVVLVICCVGMNILVGIGIFKPVPKPPAPEVVAAPPVLPTVTLTATPGTISTGTTTALTWETTAATDCMASGNWAGVKTPQGAESSGRLNKAGTFTYNLTCKNKDGNAVATTKVTVTNAPIVVTQKPSTTTSGGGAPKVTYCGGRIPCYGPHDVATHGSSGNCWGWLGDRVINVGSFDVAFHAAQSGVTNIQLSNICGKDLTPALNGQVSAPEYPGGHNHQSSAKSTSDRNYISYFIGYFDAQKP